MAGLSISLAFLFCLEVFILPGFVSGAKRDTGKYKHDTRGDSALPYKHDPAGDEALPYKHDKSGDTALPYKHDPAGKNWNSISFKLFVSSAGDKAQPYKKDENGW